ncbi:hypothetical protein LEP1GSC047_1375 [Leptospira inadai serovar Lyme str. 10]|uniref:Uncharacterized protein n=2 Tax=Leptospira inadai serovar Lyme TaxID=293084 RepID=V6H9A7_9LEPT|nr:hypothetical protein [Leptospira inadai]EQA35696.1 hypothetical protein LEP1GSC047_1375 [Leptospira inadai serovar Lyme str. 10]PNV75274.1 hypothetical protein BES34_008390 [Leptospira inadai serovar Lyme]
MKFFLINLQNVFFVTILAIFLLPIKNIMPDEISDKNEKKPSSFYLFGFGIAGILVGGSEYNENEPNYYAAKHRFNSGKNQAIAAYLITGNSYFGDALGVYTLFKYGPDLSSTRQELLLDKSIFQVGCVLLAGAAVAYVFEKTVFVNKRTGNSLSISIKPTKSSIELGMIFRF